MYTERISDMCARNSRSLLVSYLHLSHAVPVLAIWLADAPQDMLRILDKVTYEVVLEQFADYGDIVDDVHVRQVTTATTATTVPTAP